VVGVGAVALAIGLGPAIAQGSTATPAPKHMTEKQLRTYETQLLGPEHAAQHAELRTLAREAAAARAKHERWLKSLPPAQRKRQIAKEKAESKARVAKLRARAQKKAGPPRKVGKWTSKPKHIPVMAINTAMLPTGKVLFWSYPTNPNPAYNPAFVEGGIGSAPNEAISAVWDPKTGKSKIIPPPINPDTGHPANIWCSGISFLADGRVLATGGNLGYTPDWRGLQRAYIFDPWTEKWTEQGQMRHGRWYPTQVLLADGRTLVMQGYDETGTQTYNRDVEVFDPKTGQFTLLGELGVRNPDNTLATPPVGGYYPHMFLMPSGRVLTAGPDRGDSWLFNNPGNDLTWTDIPHPRPAQDRVWGTAVLVPSNKGKSSQVMLLGGSWTERDTTVNPAGPYAVKTTEVFDENNPAAGWKQAASLNIGRSHANTVLLPDGSMVEIGGGLGTNLAQNNQYVTQPGAPERQVELRDPKTGKWRLGPAQVEIRAYHSTAVLLPDGRVLSAGDDYDGRPDATHPTGAQTGLNTDDREIYSPPYLFRGPRPKIKKAPKHIKWGKSFGVSSPTKGVRRAVLIAPGAATHATDQNQRYVRLKLRRKKGGYSIRGPVDANAAPPGYYMLFLVNGRGVPSVAKWVRLGNVA
jgi:hypothetical protein